MKMNKLDKSVLKLWYIRAAIGALALVGVVVSVLVVLLATEAPTNVIIGVHLHRTAERELGSVRLRCNLRDAWHFQYVRKYRHDPLVQSS